MRRASFLQPEAFYPTRRSTAVCCCCCCLYPDVAEDRPLPASGRHSPAATQQFLSVTLLLTHAVQGKVPSPPCLISAASHQSKRAACQKTAPPCCFYDSGGLGTTVPL